ncbi:MAG: ComF family protein [Ruminococcaceae bacterium]|nr:ComF family protein [Oscillospiraceae bacterium]
MKRIPTMKNKLLKKIRLVSDILAVPKCAMCREAMNVKYTLPLCSSCNEKWKEEKNLLCPICGNRHSECECISNGYAYSPIDRSMHLINYTGSEAGKAMILRYKNGDLWRIREFLAAELSELLLSRIKGSPENIIICNVPRSRKSVKRYGHDQAASLAKIIAEYVGARYLPLIKRKGGAKQKKLDRADRFKNAEGAFAANKELIHTVLRKNVVIVDDIITSGASVNACAEILRENGARRICELCIARTYDRK